MITFCKEITIALNRNLNTKLISRREEHLSSQAIVVKAQLIVVALQSAEGAEEAEEEAYPVETFQTLLPN